MAYQGVKDFRCVKTNQKSTLKAVQFRRSAEMVVEGDATEPLPLLEWDEFRRVAAVSPQPPWSIVAIRNLPKHELDNPPIVFPPIDHENLHISPQSPPSPYQSYNIHAGNRQISFSDSDSDSDLNSSSTFSPSDSSPPPRSPISSARPADAAGWFGLWAELLNSKVNITVRFLRSALTASKGALLTYRSVAFAAVLAAVLYFRRRRRLRGGEESRDRLVGMIRKRDEKINELLDQISRMNQMLIAIKKTPTS
ncbi:uncharacterized protein LOC131020380 [Salvia miltiorrhiza]|uniref:uncharacterized protein LOC131020380 n=1 Tax=Salvia miltiorrhiza TaxID=226208 RepID=UPI0025ACD2BD|nr:uncharacterized protein LOC131020380 [Salvia miltiorrhiza]